MIDRLMMPVLMLAAFVWTVASFSAAGPLLTPAHAAPAQTAAKTPIDLGRVVIVGKREAASATVARNDEPAPLGHSTQ